MFLHCPSPILTNVPIGETEHDPDPGIPIEAIPSDFVTVEDTVRPHMDGESAGGTGPQITLVSPSTGKPLANIACAGPEELNHAGLGSRRLSPARGSEGTLR